VVNVVGWGFGPGEKVNLTAGTWLLPSAVAGPQGRFIASFEIPASAHPGPLAVAAVGEDSGRVATATFTVRTDWPQFHFSPDLVGVNPYENVLSVSNADGLTLDWEAGTVTSGYISSPAVVNGIVYISDYQPGRSDVHAIDAASGEPVWTKTVGPGPSSPAVAGGALFVGDLSGNLHARRASTGTRLWTKPAGGPVYSDPTVEGGTVFVGASFGGLAAFDAETGSLTWRFSRDNVQFSGSPAVSGGIVYAWGQPTTENGIVYALDQSTGAVIWKRRIPGSDQRLQMSPAVADGTVYVGTGDSARRSLVLALDAEVGRIRWIHALPEDVEAAFGAPAVADGLLYVPTTPDRPTANPELYALDTATGSLVWQAPVSASNSSPAVANGVVYVGGEVDENSQLSALDAVSGEILWTYVEAGTTIPILSSPAVADGRVYVGTQGETGSVLAFTLS
jgi:outer membrane protein assembly factor BamB